jgi:single-strand DNA-binding protein
MNNVSLIGRITKDLELKDYNEGKGFYTKFTLAINRKSRKDSETEADFINILVWNALAETMCKYLGKGSQIGLTGRLCSNSFTDKEGNKRYTTEVIAEDFKFLDKKKEVI